MTPEIAIVLPPREGFAEAAAGAIALCVRDFARHSRYRESITVYGGAAQGFADMRYRPMTARRHFFRSRTTHYERQLRAALGARPPALIEVQNRAQLAAQLTDIAPVALHLHNDPQQIKGCETAAERAELLARLRGVYCVSEFIRRRFLEGLDGDHDKLHVTPNGLDLPDQLAQKEPVILFAGRLAETKGALPFAEALAEALPRCPGWKGLVIGADRHAANKSSTPYERQVAAILERLAAQGLVEWQGYRPHAETLAGFARAAIAVVPSVWDEPFGRTALEAMAYGCALITSGRGGLQEVTRGAGMLVEPTAVSLAAAMVQLAEDDHLRVSIAAQGRAQAANFTIQAMSARLDRARDRLLAA